MKDEEQNDADVVSLDLFRADRMIEDKLTDVFSFVPGIDGIVRDMLDQAKAGTIADSEDLMDAIKDNLEAEVLRLMTEDETMVTKLADLVLEMMGDEGIDFDDDEPFAAPDPLSPEEKAAHRLLQNRLSTLDQQELAIALRQAQYGFEDSDTAMATALSMAPEFYETHLVHASITLRQGMMTTSHEAVERAERTCPGSPSVAALKAEILRHLGDNAGAEDCLDEALRVNDWHVGLHRARGYQRFLNKKLDMAAEDFEWLLSHSPVGEDYFHLGNIRAEMNDYEGAVEAYLRASQLDPRDAQTTANLGSALSKLGQGDQAMRAWSTASDLDPFYALPYSKRGAAYAASEQNYAAVSECLAAMLLAPEGWPYVRETSICLELSASAQRESEDAPKTRVTEEILARFAAAENDEFPLAFLDAFKQMLGPLPASLMMAEGVFLLRSGYPEEAAGTFLALLHAQPNNADALFYRGAALQDAGRYEQAIETLDRAIDQAAHAQYGWTADEARERLAEALLEAESEQAGEGPTMYSTEPDAITMIVEGRMAYAAGDLRTAREWADRAIDEDATDGMAWYFRAVLNADEGKNESALEDLATALELYPEQAQGAQDESAFADYKGTPEFDALLTKHGSGTGPNLL